MVIQVREFNLKKLIKADGSTCIAVSSLND